MRRLLLHLRLFWLKAVRAMLHVWAFVLTVLKNAGVGGGMA